MGVSKIRTKLEELNQTDVYSMVLFALYKIKDIPEYSTLSELCYLLDHKSLINFLTYFGGKTITIPTKEEMKDVLNALLLYQFINIEGKEYKEAVDLINSAEFSEAKTQEIYKKIVEIMQKYNFISRGIDNVWKNLV